MSLAAGLLFAATAAMLALTIVLLARVHEINQDSKRNLDLAESFYRHALGIVAPTKDGAQ